MFEYRYQGVVQRVVDGDTVVVQIDVGFNMFTIQPVRIYGINTPETVGADRAKGLESKKYVEDHLPPKTKVIMKTYKPIEKYGRFLAEIYYVRERDWANIGAELIEKNLAKPYFGEGQK